MKEDIAPLRGISHLKFPWEGSNNKKPWNYKVTAVIPTLDTFETLEICIDLLKSQTESPYILIIDTGSSKSQLDKINQLHSEDVEVHSLRLNGVRHPSDFPAMAMDVAFALCRSEFLFATHADCFLRKKTLLSELMEMTKTISPVVGYEISPRSHDDWKGMISHTASMYHVPTMDKIGFGWSLRRLCNMYDIVDYKPDPMRPNWPDTEILGNYILRQNKIKPHLIGHEKNFFRHVDENIDHFRSYTSGKLYSPLYYVKVKEWFENAKKEALERMAEWQRGKKLNKSA